MNFPPLNEQLDLLRRGASEIIPEDVFVQKIERSIKTQIPLNIKLGCDPSRPDLHLGHAVVLRKLRQFQDLGHLAILIIGDFTGMIGDPSGKNKTRPPLTLEETRTNGQSYFEQASKILSKNRVSIRYNSEWLGTMAFSDVIKLASKYTVARMLERDEFEKRFRNQEPISVHEFLYPLAQAMDSVAIQSDVELGGTDQKFNLLVGREIQREYGQKPQAILMMPLLEGTNGVDKMSKSLDNYIAFNDSPDDMYGKILSIPDDLIIPYLRLVTDTNELRISELQQAMNTIAMNPRDAKRELARTVVADYYSHEYAVAAEDHFDRLFKEKLSPVDIPECVVTGDSSLLIVDIMVSHGLASSKSEARRLIEQSAVSIDGEKISDMNEILPIVQECILKVGKRRFLKIIRH